MEKFRLVRPTLAHETQVMNYLKEFLDADSEPHGTSSLQEYKGNYTAWLQHVENMREVAPDGRYVPAETLLLMRRLPRQSHVVQQDIEQLVGMVNIRFGMNNRLWECGGHIGYSIRPSERRHGYNKINLYLALKVCQKYGLEAVILDCEPSNAGSVLSIRAFDGKLLHWHPYEFRSDKVCKFQRYVIDVDAALKKYGALYERMIDDLPK